MKLQVGSVVLGLCVGAALALGACALAWRASMPSPDLADDISPTLSIDLPEGPVRGAYQVAAEAHDDRPGLATLRAWVDDEPLAGAPPWTVDSSELSDGPHIVRVEAIDSATRRNRTTRTGLVLVDNTPPQIAIAASSLQGAHGNILPIAVRADDPEATLTATFLDEVRPLYRVGDFHRALVGIRIRQEPGSHPLVLTAEDRLGNRVEHTVEVTIRGIDWPGGTFRLARSVTRESRDSEAVATMRTERNGAYATVDATQHWSDGLHWPARGRVSNVYGYQRRWPDGSFTYHDAIDIGNRTGTPVYAAEAGEVLVARRQAVLGNAVIIGHGQQVTTSYNHLHRIDVREGDRVQQGDLLGRMGSTGQSTGPHLHWGMVVDEVPVDASAWPDDGFDARHLPVWVPLEHENG